MTNIEAASSKVINCLSECFFDHWEQKNFYNHYYHIVIWALRFLFFVQQKTRRVVANRPQLRIVSPRGLSEPEEISADALSVRGFEQYRCDDYHLGMAIFFSLFLSLVLLFCHLFIVSQLCFSVLSFVCSVISYVWMYTDSGITRARCIVLLID